MEVRFLPRAPKQNSTAFSKPKLTDQELRNAVYTGPWLSDAKLKFSKTNCAAYLLANDGGQLVNGSPIRQEYLETALSWINNEKIEDYMAKHQHDKNAEELWNYFEDVIAWVRGTFTNYRKEMKGVEWGAAVDTYYTPNQSDGMDTWFGSVYNTGGMPTDYRLRIGGRGDQYNSLLRFNLSGLPQVAQQAIVWLYTFPDSGTPVALNWYRLLQNWQENTATWSNQPVGTFLGWTSAPPGGYTGWYGVDITSFYNSWRRGDASYLNFGFRFSPTGTNNQFTVFYSSDYMSNSALRPTLYVRSTTVESKITLKWPLATSYTNRVVTLYFRDDWISSCNGLIKKHNGTDYRAGAGTGVYAAEDGFVKKRATTSTDNWGGYIVIEHNHPTGKFTTVYWHISPVAGIAEGDFVPKGMQIATVQDISVYGHSTHFHFGVRRASYSSPVSFAGGLPQTDCGGYPAFPANFVDVDPRPADPPSIVLFQ